MPNSSHLKTPERGLEAWNSWRKLNPRIRPDLGNAQLSQRSLRQFNFEGADFRSANLIDSDLRWASFEHADLTDARLTEAEPVQPLMVKGSEPLSIDETFARHASVLPMARHRSQQELLDSPLDTIIEPAARKLYCRAL
jgi:hypothetical protein